jgi:hypothetical protein
MVMQKLMSILEVVVSLHAWLQLCTDVQEYFCLIFHFHANCF